MSNPDDDDGALANADIRLFETGNFADATVVCGDQTWKVHKAILSSRCKWFKAAFFGNLAEAASGVVKFEEQDPNLVGIMLRFIYAKDLNMAKIADGKDMPVLSIKLFRLADFVLLKELKDKAEKELRSYLDRLLATPDDNNSDIKNTPARLLEVQEVFKCVREAYKDNSTWHIRETLLNFLWIRNGRIFQLPEMTNMILEIPGLSQDLMLTYILGDATTYIHDTSVPPKGLLVLEAVREPGSIYKAGDKMTNTPEKPPARACLLRHTPGRPSPFEAVDAKTGALIKDMAWTTPATSQVHLIGSYETSEIVCITLRGLKRKKLWLRLETHGDARFYTGCHSGVNRHVRQEKCTKISLQSDMATALGLVASAVRP